MKHKPTAKRLLAVILVAMFLVACAQGWKYTKLSELKLDPQVPDAAECKGCHEQEFLTWSGNRHGDAARMQKVDALQLRQCGACHSGLSAHLGDPENIRSADLSSLEKTEQNALCGKCHYNRDLFGRKAISPHNRHGVLMSVGFEGRKRQISCMECHSGHSAKGDMLRNWRGHICFRCHKEAIVTMGVFQPFNYIAGGKICIACHGAHGGSTGGQAARVVVGTAAVCIICHI